AMSRARNTRRSSPTFSTRSSPSRPGGRSTSLIRTCWQRRARAGERGERRALPPGHEALIVARAASARQRGVVWVEGRGAAWSDGLRLRAAATRDSLFLGRSRYSRDSDQSNDDSKRKCYPQ